MKQYQAKKAGIKPRPSRLQPSRKCKAKRPITGPYHVIAASEQLLKPPIGDKPGTMFTAFPRLPLDIQFKIWSHTLPGERFVELCFQGKDKARGITEPYYWSPARIPPILKVCRQSRFEAQRHYKLSLGYKHPGVKPVPRIYLDPAFDTVVITCERFLEFHLGPLVDSQICFSKLKDREKIRKLELCEGVFKKLDERNAEFMISPGWKALNRIVVTQAHPPFLGDLERFESGIFHTHWEDSNKKSFAIEAGSLEEKQQQLINKEAYNNALTTPV
ncbi:hypothetical protein EG329_002162 [Mollisiaceae sp. DMI_Dod_QoI]|nr:hypothetical protein EG329_002162 [Helotiales sp. DMI_Dod_QoI]